MNGQFSLSAWSRIGQSPGELLLCSSLLMLRTTTRSRPHQPAWPSSIASPNSVTVLLLECSCQALPNFTDSPPFFWVSFVQCRSRERYRRSALCLPLGYLWVYFAIAILGCWGQSTRLWPHGSPSGKDDRGTLFTFFLNVLQVIDSKMPLILRHNIGFYIAKKKNIMVPRKLWHIPMNFGFRDVKVWKYEHIKSVNDLCNICSYPSKVGLKKKDGAIGLTTTNLPLSLSSLHNPSGQKEWALGFLFLAIASSCYPRAAGFTT